jgi:hypothetical protein
VTFAFDLTAQMPSIDRFVGDPHEMVLKFLGRSVVVTGPDGTALVESGWVRFHCEGFDSEDEVEQFALELRDRTNQHRPTRRRACSYDCDMPRPRSGHGTVSRLRLSPAVLARPRTRAHPAGSAMDHLDWQAATYLIHRGKCRCPRRRRSGITTC